MRDSFASRLGDLRTEFERIPAPGDQGPLPDYAQCFDQAAKITKIADRLARLAIQANCRERLDGPFCDQVHELDTDLTEARTEHLRSGIQMAKLEHVNIEILERLVTDAGGNITLINQVERLQALT